MSVSTPALRDERAVRPGSRRKVADRYADRLLYAICVAAAILTGVVIVAVGYQVTAGAMPAISKFGLGFLTSTTWQPNFGEFGAASLIFGTAISSLFALLLGAPIAIAIGLFLSLLAPAGVRSIVSPLV